MAPYTVEQMDPAFNGCPTIYGPATPAGVSWVFALVAADVSDDGDAQVQAFRVEDGGVLDDDYYYKELVRGTDWVDALDRAIGFGYGMDRPVADELKRLLAEAGIA